MHMVYEWALKQYKIVAQKKKKDKKQRHKKSSAYVGVRNSISTIVGKIRKYAQRNILLLLFGSRCHVLFKAKRYWEKRSSFVERRFDFFSTLISILSIPKV